MNKKLIDWWIGGASYTSEYQAILDRATTLGYTHPSTSVKTKQNNYIVALKAAGIWSLLDVLYVFAGDSKNFSKINWISPSIYTCSEVGSPTFQNNIGWQSNGGALNTGFAPSNGVNFTQNNGSWFTSLDRRGTGSSTQSQLGCDPADANRRIILQIGQIRAAVNGAQITYADTTKSSGFVHADRSSSTNIDLNFNGTTLSSPLSTSTALGTNPVYICGFYNGTLFADTLNSDMRCFGMGASLASKKSDLYTTWDTYFTSL